MRALQTGVAAASVGAMTILAQPAQANNDAWIGNTSANWADAGNWNVDGVGPGPVSGDSLTFGTAGTAGLTLTDNLTTGSGYIIAGITFNGPSAFVINPLGASNNFTLTGGITNNSTALQTINEPLSLSGTQTFATGGGITVGGALTGTAGLTVTGTGTLALASTNVSAVSGTLDVEGATLNIGNAPTVFTGPAVTTPTFAAGGLTGTGTIMPGAGVATRYLTINSNTDSTFSGNLQDNVFNSSRLGLVKLGTGNLTLSGTNNTYSGQTQVDGGGTLTFAGTLNVTGGNPTAPIGSNVFVGNLTNSTGILKWVTGASTSHRSMELGRATGAGGAIYQSGGSFTLTQGAGAGNFRIGAFNDTVNTGQGQGGYGYYKISGGTATFNEIGISSDIGGNSVGVMDMTGGTITDNGWITVARGTGSTGILNITGGTYNWGLTNNISQIGFGNFVGTGTPYYGVMNVSNAQVLCPNGFNVLLDMSGVTVGGAQSVVNIGTGGLLRVGSVGAVGASTSYINFTGGTLQAAVGDTSSTAGFISGQNAAGFTAPMDAANITDIVVYSQGGTIDNNGNKITIARGFSSPVGAGNNGITSISVDSAGTGYIGAPAVVISNAPGASAVANMVDDGSGHGTFKVGSITITSPGAFTTVPTVKLVGGNAATPASIGATITTAADTSGGMTFIGSGTTFLTGNSSYTGATAVSAGTLVLSGTGAVNSSSGIAVSGGAKFVQAATTAVTPTVTLTSGTIDGTGTINNISIASAAANTLTNGGNGSVTIATPLTVGTLGFLGAGTLSPVTSFNTAGTASFSVTTMTAGGGAGSISVVPINTAGGWPANTVTTPVYKLISSAAVLPALTTFSLNTASMGLGTHQSGTLSFAAGNTELDLTIGGYSAQWSGTASASWQASPPIGSPFNWVRSDSTSTGVEYSPGDAVIFPDGASNTAAVNIAGADVNPALITFTNTSGGQPYVISSSGGFKITGPGGIIMGDATGGGGGSVTLTTANNFIGGVTVNNGTLAINNATAIGTGRLTIAGTNGTVTTALDNTTAGSITETNNNLITINGDFTYNGTGGTTLNLGTGAVTMNANAAQANAGSTTITTANGTLVLGGNITAPGLGLTKAGPGTLQIAGGTFPGLITVANGTLAVSGALVANLNNAPSLAAGFLANSNSTIIVNAGASITTRNELWLGDAASTYGSLTVNGGSVTVGSWLALGRSTAGGGGAAGVGLVNINSGGVVTVNTNNVTIGSFGGSGGIGQITVNPGGTLATLQGAGVGVFAGENFPGTLNVEGNGTTSSQVTIDSTSGNGLIVGVNGGAVNSSVNLGAVGGTTTNNGRITAPRAVGGTGANSDFNFHGGTLRANASNGAYMQGLANAYIYSEGAVIDTQAFNITIGQSLQAPTGNGVAIGTIGVTAGAGYKDTPYVQITGGGGSGATAVATINYATGALTGITITNPGTGYGTAPTFTLIGGGASSPGTVTGTAALVANSGGALSKVGTGALTLSGNNTYSGGTTLSAGRININSATALGTGALTIATAGVTIDNTTGTAITMTNANAQNWNADFVFAGTRSLKMTGNVTLGATRTVTVNGSTLTEGGIIGGAAGFGLTKAGAGTLALSGANTYTGPTSITGGTLQLSSDPGSINSSSSITLNGATAKLLQLSSTAVSVPVTVTAGTVDGTGTINSVTVASAASNVVAQGNGTVTPITIGTLALSGAATLSTTLSDATATTPAIQTTTLTPSGAAGSVAINASNLSGLWNPGTFQLVSYSTLNGTGITAFKPGTFIALGTNQTATLDNTNIPGVIEVTIAGYKATWTGAQDGNWDTASHPASQDWKRSDNSAAVQFTTGDAVIFDNNATTGNVNVAANVNVASMIFTNTSLAYNITSGGAFGISGSGGVFINGGGSVSLGTANTYTGATTVSNGSTLVINNATAIGSGVLTINGGTIDATSGAITLANNNTQNWNGDLTFTGTNNLSFGTGAVKIGGTGTVRTVTITNNDLTVGPIAGTGFGLTLPGAGTLTINSGASASTVSGDLNVSGKLQIALTGGAAANNFNAGGLVGSGVVENSSASVAANLVVANNTPEVFSGVLQDGAGSAGGGRLGLVKNGTGNLTLSGGSSLSNGITVNSGQLIVSGSVLPSVINAALGQDNVGTSSGNAILTLASGSSFNAPNTAAPSLAMGNATNTAGVLNVNNATLTTASELWLAQGDGGYGVMNMTGGSVTVGSWLAVARGGGQGVLNMSAGTLTSQSVTPATGNTPGAFTIGSFGGAAGNGIVHGLVNLTGGTINATGDAGAVASPTFVGDTAAVYAGEGTNAVLNVSGTGLLQVAGASGTIRLARFAGAVGEVNLLPGGTISAIHLTQGQGTGILNFNGGTLQALGPEAVGGAHFFQVTNYHPSAGFTGTQGTLSAYAYSGGAIIDPNGNAVNMDVPLLTPVTITGSGVSLAGLHFSGSGFIGTPVVQISDAPGDTTGIGATAVATIDGSGNLTGVTLTSPGVGYTLPPIVTLVGGGVGSTNSVTGSASLVTNVSGGLTVNDPGGLGSLTLNTAASTYTGPTTITAGLLNLNVANAIASSSQVVMNGGKLNTNGFNQTLPNTQLKTTANSTIDATGTIYQFANSATAHWVNGAVLTVSNITGNKIQFPSATSLNPNELAAVTFTGADHGALVPDGGLFDLVSTPSLPANVLLRGDADYVHQGSHVPNIGDVGALIGAVQNVNTYVNSLPVISGWDSKAAESIYLADVDYSDHIGNSDVQSLITYIANGGTGLNSPGGGSLTAVPEPGTLVLFLVGSIPGLWVARSISRKQRGNNSQADDDARSIDIELA
jgi:autotransporter-associated beta strand protein